MNTRTNDWKPREVLRMENMRRHNISYAAIARILGRSYMSVYAKGHPLYNYRIKNKQK